MIYSFKGPSTSAALPEYIWRGIGTCFPWRFKIRPITWFRYAAHFAFLGKDSLVDHISLQVYNWFEFSFTPVAIPTLKSQICFYLPADEGRIIGFIHFSRVLALRETQTTSFRVWTRLVTSRECEIDRLVSGGCLLQAISPLQDGVHCLALYKE